MAKPDRPRGSQTTIVVALEEAERGTALSQAALLEGAELERTRESQHRTGDEELPLGQLGPVIDEHMQAVIEDERDDGKAGPDGEIAGQEDAQGQLGTILPTAGSGEEAHHRGTAAACCPIPTTQLQKPEHALETGLGIYRTYRARPLGRAA